LKPAGKWVYSNAGYDTLGTLIQHKNSQSFDAYRQWGNFYLSAAWHDYGYLSRTRTRLGFADPKVALVGDYDNNSSGIGSVNDVRPGLDELVGSVIHLFISA
jgi:hypothetical protein